jgi:hypothetical protein
MQQQKEIRALYTEQFIRIYQAYNNVIAESAIKNNRFISPPFKVERATWIKPSFLWMMYRSGWATKENQERILAIDITHEGFKWALENAVLSHFAPDIYKTYEDWQKIKENAPVVIQWDPERDIYLNKLEYRTIQIGLTPPAAKLYISNWTLKITDITDTVKAIKRLIDTNKMEEAYTLLPFEKVYNPVEYK